MDEVKLNIDPEARDRIGNKWLKLIEAKIDDGSINATEQAIVARVLLQSGYTLDPTRLPKDLRSKLTEDIDINDPVTQEELGIIPLHRKTS